MGQFRLPFSALNLEPPTWLVGQENRFFLPVDTFATPERRGLMGLSNPQTDPWHLMVAATGSQAVIFELDGNALPQPELTWPTELHRAWYQLGDMILIQERPERMLLERFGRLGEPGSEPSLAEARAATGHPNAGACIVGFRILDIDRRKVALQFVLFRKDDKPVDLGRAGDMSFRELEEQFREVRRYARQRPG